MAEGQKKVTKYQQQLKGKSDGRGKAFHDSGGSGEAINNVLVKSHERAKQRLLGDQIDEIFGFVSLTEVKYLDQTYPDNNLTSHS